MCYYAVQCEISVCIRVLVYERIIALLCFCIVVLLYCCIIVLLYCYIIVLLYY